LGEEEPAECDATPLATGKGCNILLAGWAAEGVHGDVDRRIELPKPLRLDLVLGLLQLVGHPFHFGSGQVLPELRRELVVTIEDRALCSDAVLDVPAHVLRRIQNWFLREQPGAKARRDPRVADEVRVDAGHDAEERA